MLLMRVALAHKVDQAWGWIAECVEEQEWHSGEDFKEDLGEDLGWMTLGRVKEEMECGIVGIHWGGESLVRALCVQRHTMSKVRVGGPMFAAACLSRYNFG